MDKIKLNNTEIELLAFHRNTTFTGSTIVSEAGCSIVSNDRDALNALGFEKITTLQIYHDDQLIYDLQDIDATMDTINEYLDGDHVNLGLSIHFNI